MNIDLPLGWPRESQVKRSETKDLGWPRVTLVTPSFNQAMYLEDTILSVLNQDYPNFEYIVMDGGSTDQSVEIIKKYNDRLAYWESKPDRGQSHAINKGWRIATGQYVWWLNADDMLVPDALKRSVAFLRSHPEVDLVYGHLYRIDDVGRSLGLYRYPDFDFKDFVLHYRSPSQAGALIKKTSLDRIGLLNESYHYVMDRELWIRLAIAGGRIACLRQPLAIFRVYPSTKTQAGSPVAVKERYRLTQDLLRSPKLPESILSKQNTVWSSVHLVCARDNMKSGCYQLARKEVVLALHRRPDKLFSSKFWQVTILSLLGSLLGKDRLQNLRRFLRNIRRSFRSTLV